MIHRTVSCLVIAASLSAPALGQTQLGDNTLDFVYAMEPFLDGVIATGTSVDAGDEPWISDGTPGGTFVLDVNPGPASSLNAFPEFTEYRGRAYFFGSRDDTGRELYATDGTVAGTQLVKDFFPGTGSGAWLSRMVVFQDRLFLGAYDGTDYKTWVSDGTAAGTTPLADPGPADPRDWYVAEDILYFSASQDGHGVELWKTDGTAAGTTQVADIEPGAGHSSPRDFYFYQDRLYFSADTTAHGRELWVSDGTTAGTSLVSNIALNAFGSFPSNFLGRGDQVYFTASLAGGPPLLWRTDGTDAGTEALPFANEIDGKLVPVGDDVLMFAQSLGSSPSGIARYSPATGQLETVLPMSIGSEGNFVRMGSGDVYAFTGDEHFTVQPNLGREVWVTDGTTAGTLLVYDLVAGHEASVPYLFAHSGDQTFIATGDGAGKLFAGPALDFGAWLASPLGAGCEGSGGLVPVLASSGEARVGSVLELDLSDAAPNAPAILFLSLGTDYLDLGLGCALWVNPAGLAVPVATDSSGSFHLPAGFNAAQLGLHLALQFAIADPGAAGGQFTVSNAIELFVGA